MKIKIYLSIIVISILILGLINFLIPSSENNQKIDVALSLPLSGPLAYKGEKALNGALLALEKTNLNLIVEDNKGSPIEAVTILKKWFEKEKPKIIVSQFTSISNAIAPLIQKENILIYQSTVKSLAKNNEHIFRDYWDMGDAGEQLVNIAFDKDIRNISILYAKSDWGIDLNKGIIKKIKEKNMIVSIKEEFLMENTDFSSQIIKIKHSGSQGIIIAGYPQHISLILKKIKEFNMTNQKLFILDVIQPEVIENIKDLQVYGNSPCFHNKENELFKEEYFKKFNEIPTSESAFMYDEIIMINEVSQNCQEIKCILKNLKEIKSFEGVGGTTTFDEYGIGTKPLCLFEFN